MAAAEAGKAKALRVLLGSGDCGVNAKDLYGRTALMLAVNNRSTAAMGLLLDAGADPEAADRRGATPLSLAANVCKVPHMRLLVARGAQVDKRVNQGRTALMVAANTGSVAATQALLALGADADAKDTAGCDALSMCFVDECVALLKDAERIQRWHRRRRLIAWKAELLGNRPGTLGQPELPTGATGEP
ncbi:hypothetical protein FNF31_07174 [Cafeteria roenbergensis]|uniref:Uncharacterized protein n=1 Tax=Cafeteria roenbergensis TaxID=33653 RepID=A0A5A8CAQ1_CAFRO|nr:hypothetical protein FNF31_07174 [Cafeteria roenbergensis]